MFLLLIITLGDERWKVGYLKFCARARRGSILRGASCRRSAAAAIRVSECGRNSLHFTRLAALGGRPVGGGRRRGRRRRRGQPGAGEALTQALAQALAQPRAQPLAGAVARIAPAVPHGQRVVFASLPSMGVGRGRGGVACGQPARGAAPRRAGVGAVGPPRPTMARGAALVPVFAVFTVLGAVLASAGPRRPVHCVQVRRRATLHEFFPLAVGYLSAGKKNWLS